MNQDKRILGNIVAQELTVEELESISGGCIHCGGCSKSTSTTSADGYAGCKCD